MTAENILNEAIDKIIQDDQAGLEELLAAHPEVRPEIEPLLEIARQLSATLPTTAPSTFVLATRRQLILRAAARRTAQQHRKSPGFSLPRLLDLRRPAYTIVALITAIALILGSGGIATAQSLPGQPLYGAKRAAEDAPLSIIYDVIVRADYLLTLLDRRVYEVDVLSQLNAINEIAFTELRLATERALVAAQAVPLDRAVAQWTRLEEITSREEQVLTRVTEKKQVPAAIQTAFDQAWQVCRATQTQARATLSTLPPGLTRTPEPPGLTNTPLPPGLTRTPEPPGQTKTPEPPGQTKEPKPTKAR